MACFAAKTDRHIAEARNEVPLTGDELIDSVPQQFDLSDPDVVELLLDGSDLEVEEGAMTLEQAASQRHLHIEPQLRSVALSLQVSHYTLCVEALKKKQTEGLTSPMPRMNGKAENLMKF